MRKIQIDYYTDVKTNSISGWRKVCSELYLNTNKVFSNKTISFINNLTLFPFNRYLSYLLVYPKEIKIKKRSDAIAFFPHQELAYLFSFFSFRKSVVICHDIIPYLYPTNFINTLFFKFASSNLKHADKIVVDSHQTKTDLIKYLHCDEKKIVVNYPGVNEIFKQKDINREKFVKKYNMPKDFSYILYVGSEAAHKNIETLLKAYKLLESRKNVYFIKIGKAGDKFARKNTLRTIKKLGIRNISIIENVSEEDLVSFYNLASVLILPSLYEGFGFPPLEAMACGCPVIASNRSSLPEVVGKAGLLIDPESIGEIANAIDLVLTNDSIRQKMIQDGLLQARKFNWNFYSKNMIDIFNNI